MPECFAPMTTVALVLVAGLGRQLAAQPAGTAS